MGALVERPYVVGPHPGGVDDASCLQTESAPTFTVFTNQSTYPGAIMVCLHPGWVQTGMGGARAPLAVPESCAGLRRVMAGLTPADRGTFIQYDGQRLDTW